MSPNTKQHNEDAQFAADMQLAYDMQAAEVDQRLFEEQQRRHEQHQARQQRRSQSASRFPGNTPRTAGGRGSTPIVQGRASSSPPFRSATRSSRSGAQSAITSDGLSNQQNKNLIYVPAEINDRLVEMMVDTGAQSSVISAGLMRTLGLQSRLNTQMQGVAQGVGQARILGVVENCPAQIGHAEFLLYFLVLDVPQEMCIFGIDQMRRFKCVIDLEHEKLVFGGKDGVEVSFLPPEPKWVEARNQAIQGGCPIS